MPDKNKYIDTLLNPNGRIPGQQTQRTVEPSVNAAVSPSYAASSSDYDDEGFWRTVNEMKRRRGPSARTQRMTGIANKAVEGVELDNNGNVVNTAQPNSVTDPKDVSSLDDAINYLKGKADSVHVETPEQRKARERREQRTMWLSHLADGLGSFHTAYSHAAGVQPMQLQNMSDKAWERMEKARIAREGNEDRRLKYLQLMNTLETQKRQNEYNNSLMAWRRDDLERKKVNDNLATRKQDWLEKYQQGRLDIDKEKLEIEREYKAGLISKMERDAYSRELSAQATYYKAQNGGSGSRGGRNGFDKTKYKQVIVRDRDGHEIERYYEPIDDADNGNTSTGNNGSTSNNGNTNKTTTNGSGKKPNPMNSGKKKNPMT